MPWTVAMGSLAATQSVTTQDFSRLWGPGPWTDPMRRAGRVLEGGESFDSSGFSLAGQDEMPGRLNAMSGWQA